jgi:hypothetical protein
MRQENSNEVSIIWFGSTSPVYISGNTYEKIPMSFVRVIGYLKMRENQTWSIEQVESLEEVDDLEATTGKAEIPTTDFSPWGTPRWKHHTPTTTTTTEPTGIGQTTTVNTASKKKDNTQTTASEPTERGQTTTGDAFDEQDQTTATTDPTGTGQTTTDDLSKTGERKLLTVVVPNLTGRTTKSALDTLSKAGLAAAIKNPSEAAGDSQGGEVIAQNPAAGSRVRLGTAVDLTIRAIDSAELHETNTRPRFATGKALIFITFCAGALLALRIFVF